MRDINLLQSERKSDRGYFKYIKPLYFILAGVLLVSLATYGVLMFIDGRTQTNEKAVAQKIITYSDIETEKKEIQTKQDKITQMSGIIQTIVAGTTINTRILDGVSGVMPENVFIVNYAADKSGNLNLVGKSQDMSNIAYFIYKLKGTGLFTDVSLTSISGSKGNNSNSETGIYDFTAVLKLKK
ncbi:PilN domain-containing protein [Desulfitobacterium sp.]|uniref:Fimbrial assembly protein PilN n=1 Tax=bioreactor metagenome TaxID=1076179 RepID=A0A645EBM0_9ZZZZ|nr:PilN domain-containing protein [Desulfitobacterium sp.]MEA4901302.1 PilN domain-containing protein [Desulfitobacterium sp.]